MDESSGIVLSMLLSIAVIIVYVQIAIAGNLFGDISRQSMPIIAVKLTGAVIPYFVLPCLINKYFVKH